MKTRMLTRFQVDWGTEAKQNAASWRIPNGLSFIWACSLGFGILFLPESPRFAYRQGRVDEARKTMARLYNVEPNHEIVSFEINEIQEKLDAERAGGERPWYECFTGPRMLYRTLLGIVLQAGQQLTGANFFFYYGTTVFSATGLSNSFVTQIILGSVNVACTLAGLWIVENCGRRKSMMAGAAWMFMCFMIYAFVGQFALNHDDPSSTPQAGSVLIVFTCLFIAAFATTWGPMVWSICAEIYPARYRATCMALATASNWLWNFLISFFTQFITNDIDYFYGLVFGGCCFALFWIVYFFMIETKGRSLEEIDTMYILHVNPIHSAKWSPESLQKDGLVDTDKLRYSNKGNFLKDEESNAGGLMGHNSHEEGAPGPSTTEKTEATA